MKNVLSGKKWLLLITVLLLLVAAIILFAVGAVLGFIQGVGSDTPLLFSYTLYLSLSVYSVVAAVVLLVACFWNRFNSFLFGRNKVRIIIGVICILFVTVLITKQPTYYVQTIAGDSYKVPWYMTGTGSGSKVDFLVCKNSFEPFNNSCANNYTHVRIYETDNIGWYTYDYFLRNRVEAQYYSIQNGHLTYETLPVDARTIDLENTIITNSHDDYVGHGIYFIEITDESVIKRLVLCSRHGCEHYIFDEKRVIWFETDIKNERSNIQTLFKEWNLEYQRAFKTIDAMKFLP